ncbi:hypothetical protein D3C83_166460 [compost metagenome]
MRNKETKAAFDAIEARNVQGLSEAGEALDVACENCHKVYWYPKDKRTAPAAPPPASGD